LSTRVFNFPAPGRFGSPSYNKSERRFMLDVLRSNAKSVFTWVIVGGLALIFAINFGPGSLSKGGLRAASAPYAAKVNGKTIPATEWARTYDRLYQSYRQQAGESFTRELAERLGLPQQAMELVIDHELVVQEARRRGIVVTSEELTKVVQSMPSLQDNGQYSPDLYEEWARSNFGSKRKFEALLKDDLLYQKMVTALRETVKVPDAEVREAWQAESDKVGLVFVRFPLAAAEAEVAKPAEAEAKAFAEKEAERVKKFYEENRARYDQKKKVRVRHVLAKVAPGADDAAAKKKIEEAAARVKKGEDFGKVAQALSEDENTKARGGEIGFVSEGLFDEAFVKAAFALAPGAVSDPVKSASGWHLIQAEEVVPAKQVSLDDARLDIAKELLVKERARKLVQARAQAALDAARKGKALGAVFPQETPVKLGGQPVVAEETGAFGRGSSFVPKLGPAPDLYADAFAAKKGDVLPKVYETTAGPVVAAVTLRESPDPAAFASQREGLETRLRNRKETQIMSAWLKEIRSSAKVELNPDVSGALASAQTSVPD
jgi:peptidyl-prolyl cis-trans isomerase D